ncbi:MAG: GGDEF domain-containing protein [Lachnospiraceae bacterium]|nr:GGDEF domain-containing protein [Lachnospiraceae bacterium]
MEEQTVFLHQIPEDYLGRTGGQMVKPRLFVCCEHEIMEFVLEGHQLLGRPADSITPDIPVTNRYISRRHGYFDTANGKITYTAEKTTNGTIFRRRRLEAGETVDLWDGDELIIPVSDNENGVDIMLVCAIAENRIKIWRDMRLASRDALTGLSGRNTFRTWYHQKHRKREGHPGCLFIMDIDFFKRINDVYGHPAGDVALKYLTEQLLLAVGSDGYVCRWGGDEFVGVIPAPAEEVKQLLEEMGKRVAGERVDHQFHMTVSAGLTDISKVPDPDDIDAIVLLADQMLYRAKENGKNRIEL